MTQREHLWQAELCRAIDEQAVCAVLGKAVLALYAIEECLSISRSLELANACLHALSFACHEAIIGSQSRTCHAKDSTGALEWLADHLPQPRRRSKARGTS